MTVKNQEASVTYFKRKIEELTEQLELEKTAKSELAMP